MKVRDIASIMVDQMVSNYTGVLASRIDKGECMEMATRISTNVYREDDYSVYLRVLVLANKSILFQCARDDECSNGFFRDLVFTDGGSRYHVFYDVIYPALIKCFGDDANVFGYHNMGIKISYHPADLVRSAVKIKK